MLTPAKLDSPKDDVPDTKTEPKDAFSDLVDIGSKSAPTKTPKDLFVDLATPEKKSLNQLKVDKTTPKSTSPVQASEDSPVSFDQQLAVDPFGSSMPFSTADPFANDPFANTAPSAPPSTAQHGNQQGDLFTSNVTTDDDDDDDPYNIPLPQGPPPPLPQDIVNASITTDPQAGPPPPPRPSVPPSSATPPLPPRPKSASSDSFKSSSTSINSMTDLQTVNHQVTPPLPPRPRVDCSTVPVPRPRPRASIQQVEKSVCNNNTQCDSNVHQNNSVILNQIVTNANSDKSDISDQMSNISQSSAKPKRLESAESQKSLISNSSGSEQRSSSVVADPFVSTDPFATDDPFAQPDPFANDPFSPDPFSDISESQTVKSDDPFTAAVSSPRQNADDTDPFSVFDNKFLNESFKFEKSSSKKVKVKGQGKIHLCIVQVHLCFDSYIN